MKKDKAREITASITQWMMRQAESDAYPAARCSVMWSAGVHRRRYDPTPVQRTVAKKRRWRI